MRNNKEKHKAYMRGWTARNREKVREYNRKWRMSHPERLNTESRRRRRLVKSTSADQLELALERAEVRAKNYQLAGEIASPAKNCKSWGFTGQGKRTRKNEPYLNKRLKMQWRRAGAGWTWLVIDDWGAVYGRGQSNTKKEGRESAKAYMRPRKKRKQHDQPAAA